MLWIAMIAFVVFVPLAQAQEEKRPDVLTLSKTAVWSLAFSADGKMLASASVGRPPNNDLKLWDWETGTLKSALAGHTDHIFCVAFSPDGKALATTGADKTVRLWDIAAGKEKAVLVRDQTRLKAVRFSGDGKTLGVAGNKWIRLVDVETGKQKSAVEIHPTGSGYCFNPTLELMAYAPDAWYIHLVDTATSKTKILLTGLKGNVQSMAFSNDGKWLASYGNDRTLRVWDVTAGKQKAVYTVQSGRAVALSNDGKTVALGIGDCKVRMWDFTTNKELPSLHDERLATIYSLAFTPDGKSLAVGGQGTIRLWRLPAR